MTSEDKALIQRVRDVALENIRIRARKRHELARKAAKARGRLDFPMLPYECSWSFEMEFDRQRMLESSR